MKKQTRQEQRILLIDDHPTMRAGLAMLLSHVGYTICCEAGNRDQLLGCIHTCNAEVALLDLSLAEEDGLELLEVLRQQDIATLVYSMHENWNAIEKAFELGAQGYVTKREGPNVLLEALEHIFAGERYISPRASSGLCGRILDNAVASQLSVREEQILGMLGNGETNRDIANKLNLSPHTVQTYYTRLKEKLGLRGMKNLRKAAIQRRS